LQRHNPDLILVQGDTTTVFCAALAAFYRRVAVGHVEAGLRTGNKLSPFPEEINRVLASRLTDLHFAPTETARQNLLREGIAPEGIFVTGNTVIDALLIALEKVKRLPPQVPGLPAELMNGSSRQVVLITGHRRENFGGGFESICCAIEQLAQRFPDTAFVYPVHLNPNVRGPVHALLSGRKNIYLIEPQGYLPFVALMSRSRIILTDSGGVQEEAPSLGKPVLVMRDTTERPEAVQAGTVKLVGTDAQAIVDTATELLTDAGAYDAMSKAINPYGDGRAVQRIVAALRSTNE
jgi:UDP-N-acetylglucosamine 2-epimerase (non-hydrolysing)